MLDLDYEEDSNAEADANFVLTGSGAIVEIQATGEKRGFSQAEFDALFALARRGHRRAVRTAARSGRPLRSSSRPIDQRNAHGPLPSPRRQAGGRATHNPGKVPEIAALLDGRFDLVTAGELGLPEPEETETTFVGNALLKARAAADACGPDRPRRRFRPVGRGAWTARPASTPRAGPGPGKDFAIAMRQGRGAAGRDRRSDDRSAWFTSRAGRGLAATGRRWWSRAASTGRWSSRRAATGASATTRSSSPRAARQTFGEMEPAAKDAISHRARAFAKLKAALF